MQVVMKYKEIRISKSLNVNGDINPLTLSYYIWQIELSRKIIFKYVFSGYTPGDYNSEISVRIWEIFL